MPYSGAKNVILMAGVATLLAGCGAHPAGAPTMIPAPHSANGSEISPTSPQAAAAGVEAGRIVIDSFAYSPREISVPLGSRVQWVNRDDVPHTVTSTAKPKTFDSGALDGEESFAFVFQAPGTYHYFCALHPHMTGKVIVKQSPRIED
jgi:plastocyanin